MKSKRSVQKPMLVLAAIALLAAAAAPAMAADPVSGDLSTGNQFCLYGTIECPPPFEPYPVIPGPEIPGACRILPGGYMLCPYPPFFFPPIKVIMPVF